MYVKYGLMHMRLRVSRYAEIHVQERNGSSREEAKQEYSNMRTTGIWSPYEKAL